MAYANFIGPFYDIPEIDGIAIPSENLRHSIVGAAKLNRLGTAVLPHCPSHPQPSHSFSAAPRTPSSYGMVADGISRG